MATAALLARGLDAQRQGHNWRCPCPLGCGYSLSFCDSEDGLLAHCFGGCEYNEVLSALVECGLLDDDDGAQCHIVSPSVIPTAAEELERIETARWIYGRLVSAVGTVAAVYLRARRITIQVPQVLRFGNCPHRGGFTWASTMAAPVVGVIGEQIGVHMTYLRADGSGKADFSNPEWQRECRGVVRGGAIRLAPHDPGRALIISEGVETCLSAMQLLDLPGWSAVSAGGLKTLELPSEVRQITIGADNDSSGAGQRSALAAYERWSAEGRSVRIIKPSIPGDFNDVLAGRG